MRFTPWLMQNCFPLQHNNNREIMMVDSILIVIQRGLLSSLETKQVIFIAHAVQPQMQINL